MEYTSLMYTMQQTDVAKGHKHPINDLIYLVDPDIFITASEDGSIRIWTRPMDKNYYERTALYFHTAAVCMEFDYNQRGVFVGLDNGLVAYCRITPDFSGIKIIAEFHVHRSRLLRCSIEDQRGIMVTCGMDKYVCAFSILTRTRLSELAVPHTPSSLLYPKQTKHAFVGLTSGEILIYSVQETGMKNVATYAGHSDEVTCLVWDDQSQRLFSGSKDHTIVVWDVSNENDVTHILHVHSAPILSLDYMVESNKLLSLDKEGELVMWNMSVHRIPPVDLHNGKRCERCNKPFYWMLSMWESYTQHHCRKCGSSVCSKCCSLSVYPRGGYEEPVNICTGCAPKLTQTDLATTITRHELMGAKKIMWCPSRQVLASIGYDDMLRTWKFSTAPPLASNRPAPLKTAAV